MCDQIHPSIQQAFHDASNRANKSLLSPKVTSKAKSSENPTACNTGPRTHPTVMESVRFTPAPAVWCCPRMVCCNRVGRGQEWSRFCASELGLQIVPCSQLRIIRFLYFMFNSPANLVQIGCVLSDISVFFCSWLSFGKCVCVCGFFQFFFVCGWLGLFCFVLKRSRRSDLALLWALFTHLVVAWSF